MNNTLIMLFFILSGNTNVWINAKKTCRGGKQTENSRQLCPHSNISLSCFFTSVGSHTMVWICFNSMHINDYGTQCLFSASCMEVVAATSLFNQWMTGLDYACSELVHMTCCPTTSEIKSVPNSWGEMPVVIERGLKWYCLNTGNTVSSVCLSWNTTKVLHQVVHMKSDRKLLSWERSSNPDPLFIPA